MKRLMPNKRIVSFGLTGILLASIFTGCGEGNAPAASDDGAAAQPSAQASAQATDAAAPATAGETTIRIAWWGNQLRNDTTVAMLDAYTAEKPNVTFEAEFTDWSGYWDKLATQAASNNLPDIIQQDYSYITQYYTRNQLANLSTLVDEGKIDVSNISDTILTMGSFDNELYALCAGVNAVGMFYNTKFASDAGVEVPIRATYSELQGICADIYAKTGIISMSAGGNGTLSMMSRDVGEMMYDDANKKIGSSEATVRYFFDQVKKNIESEWHASVDVLQEASTSGVEDKPMSKGTAFNEFPGGSNMLAAHQAPIEDELAIMMFPTREDATSESMYLRPAMYWSISESSTNKDVAADVLNFYTNAEKAQDLLKAERGVPVSSTMAEYLKPKLDPVQQKVFNYIAEVTKIAVPCDPPQPAGANEVNKLLDDLSDMVRYGALTPEEATARFITEANAILAKASAA